jgi:hypothetical protein
MATENEASAYRARGEWRTVQWQWNEIGILHTTLLSDARVRGSELK